MAMLLMALTVAKRTLAVGRPLPPRGRVFGRRAPADESEPAGAPENEHASGFSAWPRPEIQHGSQGGPKLRTPTTVSL
eukprot:13053863-Alexandrium_andersonii.AAC.1